MFRGTNDLEIVFFSAVVKGLILSNFFEENVAYFFFAMSYLIFVQVLGP